MHRSQNYLLLRKKLYLFLLHTRSHNIYYIIFCYIKEIINFYYLYPVLLYAYFISNINYYSYFYTSLKSMDQFLILHPFKCLQSLWFELYYHLTKCIHLVCLHLELSCIYCGVSHVFYFDTNSLNQFIILPMLIIRFYFIYLRLYYSLLNMKCQLIFLSINISTPTFSKYRR